MTWNIKPYCEDVCFHNLRFKNVFPTFCSVSFTVVNEWKNTSHCCVLTFGLLLCSLTPGVEISVSQDVCRKNKQVYCKPATMATTQRPAAAAMMEVLHFLTLGLVQYSQIWFEFDLSVSARPAGNQRTIHLLTTNSQKSNLHLTEFGQWLGSKGKEDFLVWAEKHIGLIEEHKNTEQQINMTAGVSASTRHTPPLLLWWALMSSSTSECSNNL